MWGALVGCGRRKGMLLLKFDHSERRDYDQACSDQAPTQGWPSEPAGSYRAHGFLQRLSFWKRQCNNLSTVGAASQMFQHGGKLVLRQRMLGEGRQHVSVWMAGRHGSQLQTFSDDLGKFFHYSFANNRANVCPLFRFNFGPRELWLLLSSLRTGGLGNLAPNYGECRPGGRGRRPPTPLRPGGGTALRWSRRQ